MRLTDSVSLIPYDSKKYFHRIGLGSGLSISNFDGPESKPSRNLKKIKMFLAVGVIAGAIGIQSTFASNITLNIGGNVEFGQGVAQATTCDDDITVTPYSIFVNETGGGEFKFSSLKISGIDSTSGKCSGKTFLIKAYSDSGLLDLFNYSDIANSQDVDYSSIEIGDNAGVFTWRSGGTDGDDVENDENVGADDRDLTDTSFTLNLTSAAATITRTPLALSEEVKRITVETYDANLLSDRVLSTSQVGVFLPGSLEEGIDVPLEGGNFVGECQFPECFSYFTIVDWISNITDEDALNLSEVFELGEFTRSELSEAISVKFVYDAEAASDSRWILKIFILGNQILPGEAGNIPAFDGNTGIWVSPISVDTAFFFSLNGALHSNSLVGTWTPYGDQPSRTIPIRDFNLIHDPSLNDGSYDE